MAIAVRPVVRIEDDTTRAELAEVLAHLNATAKALTRRGYTSTRGAEYARIHEQINHVITDWLEAQE